MECEGYMEKRISFELFKSNVCHRLKECGDIDFIIQTLEDDDISKYYDMCWYAESFYLLGMLDYISRVNDVPQCDKYDDIRKYKLDKTIYPLGIQCISKLNDDDTYKQKVLENAIPEFLRFNIVENEVRKVV